MSDRPEKAEKQRISVTMTQAYVEVRDGLVEEGLYLNRGQVIREGLRYVFRGYGLAPFRFSEGPPRRGEKRPTSMSDDGRRRAVERRREEIMRAWREYAQEHMSPELREEIRRGAEPFRRALSLARYIGLHSRKGWDMR